MGRGVFVVLGTVSMWFAGCTSGCLFLFNLESATHPQSPVRSWDLAAGDAIHETLEVDQSGWPSPGLDVTIGVPGAPSKSVACTLRVEATTPAGTVVRQSDAPVTRPSGCHLAIDAPGRTRLSVDATNLSDQSVIVWVTPALPGFDRRIKTAWSALAGLAGLGAALTVLGAALERRAARRSRASL